MNRLKEFTFKTRDFTLDLPKPMLLADVAVRVLYLSYDLLSPLSKTYHRPATSTSIVVGSTANLIVKEEELGETVNEETNDNKSIRTTGTPKEPLSRVIIGKVYNNRDLIVYSIYGIIILLINYSCVISCQGFHSRQIHRRTEARHT